MWVADEAHTLSLLRTRPRQIGRNTSQGVAVDAALRPNCDRVFLGFLFRLFEPSYFSVHALFISRNRAMTRTWNARHSSDSSFVFHRIPAASEIVKINIFTQGPCKVITCGFVDGRHLCVRVPTNARSFKVKTWASGERVTYVTAHERIEALLVRYAVNVCRVPSSARGELTFTYREGTVG